MSRYIDAELLLEDNTYEWFDDWGNYTGAGLAVVDAPTADVVEVVHASWELVEEDFERIYICTACKNYEAWGDWERTPYCPNCGAKMDEEKVE